MSGVSEEGVAVPPISKGAQACFSENLATWRRKNDLLLKQLAPDLGVSISTLQAWEAGRRFPTPKHLDAIATTIGVPVYRLLCPAPSLEQAEHSGVKTNNNIDDAYP